MIVAVVLKCPSLMRSRSRQVSKQDVLGIQQFTFIIGRLSLLKCPFPVKSLVRMVVRDTVVSIFPIVRARIMWNSTHDTHRGV